MRRVFRPILTAGYTTTTIPGATGEAIRLAQSIGADALHLAFIEVHPFGHPETGALDVAARYAAPAPAGRDHRVARGAPLRQRDGAA